MKKPDIPFDEAERLSKLRSLDILDTGPEERFDRIVRMAQKMFDVPIALVSLVDENRQWFKACIGLDAEETSREVSFCAHAINGDEVFIIPNTLEDARFADNPLVTGEPLIRFYAGCPLRYRGGSKLGTLCIIDQKPRYLDGDDITLLKDLAATVERELSSLKVTTIDELTGLSNLRGFVSHGQHLLRLCHRENLDVSLIYIGVKNLGLINDQFGIHDGDDVLIGLANQMQGFFRDTDMVARVGGSEFAVMITNNLAREAEERMQQFLLRLEKYNKVAERNYDVELSHCVVQYDGNSNEDVENMLADAARQLSKQ